MATEEVSKNVKGVFQSLSQDSVIIIFVVICMIIIIIVTIYIVKMMRNSNLKQVPLTKKLISFEDKLTVPFKVPASALSVTSRGQEFSYSFWIYLGEYATTVNHKLVYQRGTNPGNSSVTTFPSTTSPIIALHKGTNKLMFALSTTASSGTNSLDDIFNKKSGYLVATIDYLPLHRWIFASMVLRDNVLTIYMDGDIYSVITTADIPTSSSSNRPIVSASYGDGFIGDLNQSTPGFVSKFSFYNYAVTQSELKHWYNNGPVTKSMLSFFGIANYGLRSPIYNLQDEPTSSSATTK